ncbi:hypothetical protein BH11BAC1_BH11BAC1_09840 [soil metagenome]
MESGKIVVKMGVYCCLYHLKNKKKLLMGSVFPRCDFASLNCEGNWHLLKEIHEKTRAEIDEMRNRQKRQQNKRKGIDSTFMRKLKEPKHNRWDLDKW